MTRRSAAVSTSRSGSCMGPTKRMMSSATAILGIDASAGAHSSPSSSRAWPTVSPDSPTTMLSVALPAGHSRSRSTNAPRAFSGTPSLLSCAPHRAEGPGVASAVGRPTRPAAAPFVHCGKSRRTVFQTFNKASNSSRGAFAAKPRHASTRALVKVFGYFIEGRGLMSSSTSRARVIVADVNASSKYRESSWKSSAVRMPSARKSMIRASSSPGSPRSMRPALILPSSRTRSGVISGTEAQTVCAAHIVFSSGDKGMSKHTVSWIKRRTLFA
mmetsp:Transcript_41567/g.107546  ORF Transcript_41567/g.107546 Transcript_41567/m.107546 type:complete len:272 (+) Transcript_41567:350-1165(+)